MRTLERIGSKPGTTRRDLLTSTRRIVRHLCELRSTIRAERQALTRQSNRLRQSGPFSGAEPMPWSSGRATTAPRSWWV